jgi:hypothetical protein
MEGNTDWLIALAATFLISLAIGRFFKSPWPNMTAGVLAVLTVIGGFGVLITCAPGPSSSHDLHAPLELREMFSLSWLAVIGMFLGSLTNVTYETFEDDSEEE